MDSNTGPLYLKPNILPLSHRGRDTSRRNWIQYILWIPLWIQQLWIANRIMDIPEKSCFLSLIYQRPPINQISYYKDWAVLETPTVCTNRVSTNITLERLWIRTLSMVFPVAIVIAWCHLLHFSVHLVGKPKQIFLNGLLTKYNSCFK